MTRVLYLIAMYSGLRAGANRFKSCFLPKPPASEIDGAKLTLSDGESARICVHGRKLPKETAGRNAGMISVYLESPGVSRLLYRWFRLTSHFGCGHIELAIYREHNQIVFYAVRNMLKSNTERLGLRNTASKLKWSRDQDEMAVLNSVIDLLNEKGFTCRFADPDECVQLAVQPELLHPERAQATLTALRRKYDRIGRRINGTETVEKSSSEKVDEAVT